MDRQHFKYGAVGFRAKASPSRINRFVNNLPAEKRASLYQVAEELKTHGLVETTGRQTHTHNKNMFTRSSR